MLANKLMNTEGKLTMERAEDSEVIQLNEPQEDDEESFGDLEDDNAVMEEEVGQRIIIDEDTMESNDLLLGTSDPTTSKQPPSPTSSPEVATSPSGTVPSKSTATDTFYKGLVRKLEESSYNDQTLQPSYLDFETQERSYLQQVKILYCHFLIGDKTLTKEQFQQLRALLFVPNYGQSLIKWANRKYGHTLTLPLALERLDLMEKAILQPKRRCYDELRLLVMLALLLIIIKLLS